MFLLHYNKDAGHCQPLKETSSIKWYADAGGLTGVFGEYYFCLYHLNMMKCIYVADIMLLRGTSK